MVPTTDQNNYQKYCKISLFIILTTLCIITIITLLLPMVGILGSHTISLTKCEKYSECLIDGFIYFIFFILNNLIITMCIWLPIYKLTEKIFINNQKVIIGIFLFTYIPTVLYLLPLVGLISIPLHESKCGLENYHKFMMCTLEGEIILPIICLILCCGFYGIVLCFECRKLKQQEEPLINNHNITNNTIKNDSDINLDNI